MISLETQIARGGTGRPYSILLNTNKPTAKAHHWQVSAEDTACHMWATGGMKRNRRGYRLFTELPEGREICTMCEVNHSKMK